MLQTVIEGATLILGITVLIFGSSLRIKTVLVPAVFTIALALNIIRLVRAIMFRRALKDGRRVSCGGVVKLAFTPTGMRNPFATAHALAEYTVNGKAVKGWMIGVYNERLKPDDRVKIIVNGRDPTMFAFSEKQVSTAVMNYSIFTAVSAVIEAANLFALFLFISQY